MTLRLRLPSGLAIAIALLACGARTQLDVPSSSQPVTDGGPTGADGGPTNPVDSGIPPVDSGTPCDDGGHPELSYVLDDVGGLWRYDVLTGKVTPLGTPDCGNDNVQWTMTASRTKAYILYTDWTLYVVDLATLACSQTPFQNGQLGFDFDYGIAVSSSSGTDRLYVYGLPSGATNPILAVSDLTSFVLTRVGDILPAPPPSTYPVNLTADTMGHLYAFSPSAGSRRSTRPPARSCSRSRRTSRRWPRGPPSRAAVICTSGSNPRSSATTSRRAVTRRSSTRESRPWAVTPCSCALRPSVSSLLRGKRHVHTRNERSHEGKRYIPICTQTSHSRIM